MQDKIQLKVDKVKYL
jgi:hypothetical protein